jgi:hypothetical protein
VVRRPATTARARSVGASAAVGEAGVGGEAGAPAPRAMALDGGDLGLGAVAGEAVEGDDDLDAEAGGDPQVVAEVGGAALDGVDVGDGHELVERLADGDLGDAGVDLEGADGADDDDAGGLRPALRALMCMNFSRPRSAPKPHSVTTQGARVRAKRVASRELLPWAMLAKGPAWIRAGVPSLVWREGRVEGVAQEHAHGPGGAELGDGDGVADRGPGR